MNNFGSNTFIYSLGANTKMPFVLNMFTQTLMVNSCSTGTAS